MYVYPGASCVRFQQIRKQGSHYFHAPLFSEVSQICGTSCYKAVELEVSSFELTVYFFFQYFSSWL